MTNFRRYVSGTCAIFLIATAVSAMPGPAHAGCYPFCTMNGMDDVESGEAGYRLGLTVGSAFGAPGANEMLDAETHQNYGIRDTGAPATFEVPVSPPVNYSPGYYYAPSGGGYYLGGGGTAVR